jgi:hypothetical protein
VPKYLLLSLYFREKFTHGPLTWQQVPLRSPFFKNATFGVLELVPGGTRGPNGPRSDLLASVAFQRGADVDPAPKNGRTWTAPFPLLALLQTRLLCFFSVATEGHRGVAGRRLLGEGDRRRRDWVGVVGGGGKADGWRRGYGDGSKAASKGGASALLW